MAIGKCVSCLIAQALRIVLKRHATFTSPLAMACRQGE